MFQTIEAARQLSTSQARQLREPFSNSSAFARHLDDLIVQGDAASGGQLAAGVLE